MKMFTILVLSLLIHHSEGNPSGSPICDASTDAENSAGVKITDGMGAAKSGDGGFTIVPSSSSFELSGTDLTITVSHSTKKVKGLLLYTERGSTRVGQFVNVPSSHKYSPEDCVGNMEATLTHSAVGTSSSYTFTWTPPSTPSSDDVVIKGIAVGDNAADWYILTPVTLTQGNSADSNTRLAEGGRVELYRNGTWGTVCQDILGYNWQLQNASHPTTDVICRSLGYTDASQFRYLDPAFVPDGSGIVKMDVDRAYAKKAWLCNGSNVENSLFDCHPNLVHWDNVNDNPCGHEKDIGVSCDQPLATIPCQYQGFFTSSISDFDVTANWVSILVADMDLAFEQFEVDPNECFVTASTPQYCILLGLSEDGNTLNLKYNHDGDYIPKAECPETWSPDMALTREGNTIPDSCAWTNECSAAAFVQQPQIHLFFLISTLILLIWS